MMMELLTSGLNGAGLRGHDCPVHIMTEHGRPQLSLYLVRAHSDVYVPQVTSGQRNIDCQ